MAVIFGTKQPMFWPLEERKLGAEGHLSAA